MLYLNSRAFLIRTGIGFIMCYLPATISHLPALATCLRIISLTYHLSSPWLPFWGTLGLFAVHASYLNLCTSPLRWRYLLHSPRFPAYQLPDIPQSAAVVHTIAPAWPDTTILQGREKLRKHVALWRKQQHYRVANFNLLPRVFLLT